MAKSKKKKFSEVENISLKHFSNYFIRFYYYLGIVDTHKDAYLLTEKDYKSYFENSRYSSYDSFKQAKYNYLRSIKLKRKYG